MKVKAGEREEGIVKGNCRRIIDRQICERSNGRTTRDKTWRREQEITHRGEETNVRMREDSIKVSASDEAAKQRRAYVKNVKTIRQERVKKRKKSRREIKVWKERMFHRKQR